MKTKTTTYLPVLLISLLVLVSMAAIVNCKQQNSGSTTSTVDDDDDTHFDEDVIRDKLEDLRDYIYDFVTSPAYKIYWNIFTDKAVQLFRNVDKRSINLFVDLVTKNPEFLKKLVEVSQKKRQETVQKYLNDPDAMKKVTDWISSVSKSDNPMETITNVIGSLGKGLYGGSKAGSDRNASEPPSSATTKSSTGNGKEEL